jgi:hypothetical protein
MQSTGDVLPPYTSLLNPISAQPTGIYNASLYSAAYTSPPGVLLPSVNGGLIGSAKPTTQSCVGKRKLSASL